VNYVKELQEQLNSLWAGVVEQLQFDILNHKITFHIKVNNGIVQKSELIFKEVSAYYFIENSGDERLNLIEPDDGDYLELTSIDYYENGVGLVSIQSSSIDWVEQYYSSANFVLELWSSMLLIEAKSVTINGKAFNVTTFSPYAKAKVEVKNLKGNHYHDYRAANKAIGLGNSTKPPAGYTWHHVEDGKTMMLVPRDLHRAVKHTGGASLIKKGLAP
jgi:hypothetical protein